MTASAFTPQPCEGIITETGFERVARQGRIPAWISLPIADIASRRRSSSTRLRDQLHASPHGKERLIRPAGRARELCEAAGMRCDYRDSYSVGDGQPVANAI